MKAEWKLRIITGRLAAFSNTSHHLPKREILCLTRAASLQNRLRQKRCNSESCGDSGSDFHPILPPLMCETVHRLGLWEEAPCPLKESLEPHWGKCYGSHCLGGDSWKVTCRQLHPTQKPSFGNERSVYLAMALCNLSLVLGTTCWNVHSCVTWRKKDKGTKRQLDFLSLPWIVNHFAAFKWSVKL